MMEVVIASAVRTAIGTFGGSLREVPAVDLGALVVKEAIQRAGISAEQVEAVFLGNVLQAGLGQNPARQAGMRAGLPMEVPAVSINMVCGSGLQAVNMAAQAIIAGDAEVVVAGGMENMSRAPYILDRARWGLRMGDGSLVDVVIKDGLWCAFGDTHMGITAENIAARYGISREEQDALALSSQQRAAEAIKNGRFRDEIVPVVIPQKKGTPLVFDVDEFPRAGTTPQGLAGLKPAFKTDGSVTAGNASGINDGAAALVVMSANRARELGVKPLAVIDSFAAAGVDPSVMGTGPIPASRKALDRAGLTVKDIDLVEANEAFAAQAATVIRELRLDPQRTNVNGGAIALGHPIGASGARILVTLLHEMVKRECRHGLATLCIGGGQGVATVVQRRR